MALFLAFQDTDFGIQAKLNVYQSLHLLFCAGFEVLTKT